LSEEPITKETFFCSGCWKYLIESILVPRLEPAIAALRAGGIEPDPIIDLGDVIPGFRLVFFRDREGDILELMEGYRDEER